MDVGRRRYGQRLNPSFNVEERQASLLPRGESHASPKKLVVLAREGTEHRVLELKSQRGERHSLERLIRTGEDIRPEDGVELCGIRCASEFFDDI